MQGNIINRLMEQNSTEPKAGEFATIIHHIDRTVVHVNDVAPDGTVTLAWCVSKADPNTDNDMGHQNWVHEVTSQTFKIKKRAGKWKTVHTEYHWVDPDMSSRKLFKESPEIFKELYENDSVYQTKLIPGLNKEVKRYTPINIIFGRADYYYCWEF